MRQHGAEALNALDVPLASSLVCLRAMSAYGETIGVCQVLLPCVIYIIPYSSYSRSKALLPTQELFAPMFWGTLPLTK